MSKLESHSLTTTNNSFRTSAILSFTIGFICGRKSFNRGAALSVLITSPIAYGAVPGKLILLCLIAELLNVDALCSQPANAKFLLHDIRPWSLVSGRAVQGKLRIPISYKRSCTSFIVGFGSSKTLDNIAQSSVTKGMTSISFLLTMSLVKPSRPSLTSSAKNVVEFLQTSGKGVALSRAIMAVSSVVQSFVNPNFSTCAAAILMAASLFFSILSSKT